LIHNLRSPNLARIGIIFPVAMFFSNLPATNIQILELLVQNMASKSIVCAKRTSTWRTLRALISSSNRSRLCQDVPSIAQSSASHGPSGNVLINVSIQDCLRAASIRQERERSEELLKQFIRVGNTCLDNGGDCSFEWPRYCSGWALPCLQEWILEKNLHSAASDGCAVGVEADGKPARKPWRFVSSSSRLVENLAAQKCTHTAHEPLQGKWTRMSAINSEKQGLLANGTWDESKIRPKAEVLAEARAKGQKIHVGALMVIVSIKGYEKSPAEWSIKARIVFRGDAVRDEDNQAAVFDELAASAPTSLGGLNLVIAFGLLDGHTCSTSDCNEAYFEKFGSQGTRPRVESDISEDCHGPVPVLRSWFSPVEFSTMKSPPSFGPKFGWPTP